MPKFHTAEELFLVGKKIVVTSNPEIDPGVVDRQGSDANLMLAAQAGMGEAVASQLAQAFAGLFVGTSDGEDLRTIVFDHYGMVFKDATSSVGELQYTRSVAGAAFTILAGSRISTKNTSGANVIVETIEDLSFALNETGAKTVKAKATETGAKTNVKANLLTVPVDAIGDTNTTVTNPAPFAGGTDDESDEALRQRYYAFPKTLRRGTLDAIELGALSVAGVAQADADEVLEAVPDGFAPYGQVDLTLGDGDGIGNATMAEDVPEALIEYRAAGVYVRTVVGIQRLVSISVDPDYLADGSSTAARRELVRLSIVAHVNALSAKDTTLELATILKACKQIPGVLMPEGAVIEPAGDLVAADGETFRTNSTLVKVNGL